MDKIQELQEASEHLKKQCETESQVGSDFRQEASRLSLENRVRTILVLKGRTRHAEHTITSCRPEVLPSEQPVSFSKCRWALRCSPLPGSLRDFLLHSEEGRRGYTCRALFPECWHWMAPSETKVPGLQHMGDEAVV